MVNACIGVIGLMRDDSNPGVLVYGNIAQPKMLGYDILKIPINTALSNDLKLKTKCQ